MYIFGIWHEVWLITYGSCNPKLVQSDEFPRYNFLNVKPNKLVGNIYFLIHFFIFVNQLCTVCPEQIFIFDTDLAQIYSVKKGGNGFLVYEVFLQQSMSTQRGRVEIGGVYLPLSWSVYIHHNFVCDGR